jgi:hypothetical protein
VSLPRPRAAGGIVKISIKTPSTVTGFLECNITRSIPKQWASHETVEFFTTLLLKRAGQTLGPDAKIFRLRYESLCNPSLCQFNASKDHCSMSRIRRKSGYYAVLEDQKQRLSKIQSNLLHLNSKHMRIAIYNNNGFLCQREVFPNT